MNTIGQSAFKNLPWGCLLDAKQSNMAASEAGENTEMKENSSTEPSLVEIREMVPDTFESRFFAKKNFEAKLNITSLASFSKKNILQILRRARIINKKVFSNEILSPTRVL